MEKRIAGGVTLIDISELVRDLMIMAPILRDRSEIVRLYVHHSGADGRSDIDGAIASARFALQIREWRMPPYHYWIPREPRSSQIEVYQMAPVEWRCFHTGKAANGHGVGLAVQGNTNRKPITSHQAEALEAAIPYIQETVLQPHPPGEDWLSWHSEADKYGGRQKPWCPGTRLQNWLEEYREGVGMFPDAEWQ